MSPSVRVKPTGVRAIDHVVDIGTLTLLKTINNILNLESLDLIDKITLIDSITKIDSVGLIEEITHIKGIGSIDSAQVSTNPLLNPRFRDGFDSWDNRDPTHITLIDDPSFGKKVKFNNSDYYLRQYVWADTNIYKRLMFWAYKPADGVNIEVVIQYHGQPADFITFTLTNDWITYEQAFPVNRVVFSVSFIDDYGVCYLAFPLLV